MLFTSIQTMMLLLFMALMGADGSLWPVNRWEENNETQNTEVEWNEIRKLDRESSISIRELQFESLFCIET